MRCISCIRFIRHIRCIFSTRPPNPPQQEGLKIGVIVNDLAEVNIDKALVSTKASGGYGSVAEDDLVELKNGCACCTVSDELMTSIDNLMRHAQTRDSYWDHIVIEATGVAEPREIRDNFAVAVEKTEYVLHTLVTVIDSSTFLKEFEKRNKVQQRPDLGSDEYAELSSRQVVDLMCEQVEVADVSHTHTHTPVAFSHSARSQFCLVDSSHAILCRHAILC
mgnify:FL=1